MQRSEHTILALREFMVRGGDHQLILCKLGSHPWILSDFSQDSLPPQGFIRVSDTQSVVNFLCTRDVLRMSLCNLHVSQVTVVGT